jgi:hypothetical protein
MSSKCSADNGSAHGDSFTLVAPATGTNTLAITLSGTAFGIRGGGVSFTGVDQSTPTGACATATGNSTTPSVDVSSAVGEIVIDHVVMANAGSLAAHASQDEEYNGSDGSGNADMGSSTEAGAPTTTMSWLSGSGAWAINGFGVKPVAAAASMRTLGLLGVGQ